MLPAKHFSGRLLPRNQTLFAGFAFITPDRKVYYTGDGGYDGRFKRIGEQFSGFVWHWWKTDNTMKLGTACI